MDMTGKGKNDIVVALQRLQGGVVDTSTLIYLDRLSLLALAGDSFCLLVLPQVVREYGVQPPGTILVADADGGPADLALCRIAAAMHQAVFSEDKKVLQTARRANLSYYNTLMLIIALCSRRIIPLAAFADIRHRLLQFARYSSGVVAKGDDCFAAVRHHAMVGRS